MTAPDVGERFTVQRVQPYQARKPYLCPGCNQDVEPGIGHLVVVPDGHRTTGGIGITPCWEHRERRRPGRLR